MSQYWTPFLILLLQFTKLSSSDLEDLGVNNYIYLNTRIYVAMTIGTNTF